MTEKIPLIMFIFGIINTAYIQAEILRTLPIVPIIPNIIREEIPKHRFTHFEKNYLKQYQQFRKNLVEHIEIVDKFLTGEIEANCDNLYKYRKILTPPQLPNDRPEEIYRNFENFYLQYSFDWYLYGTNRFEIACNNGKLWWKKIDKPIFLEDFTDFG